MKIHVNKSFKFAERGHNVIDIGEGEQEVSQECGEAALRNGWASKQAEMPENKAVQPPNDKQYPIEKGAGWYLLSNGEKVRGKQKAKDTQKELDK